MFEINDGGVINVFVVINVDGVMFVVVGVVNVFGVVKNGVFVVVVNVFGVVKNDGVFRDQRRSACCCHC